MQHPRPESSIRPALIVRNAYFGYARRVSDTLPVYRLKKLMKSLSVVVLPIVAYPAFFPNAPADTARARVQSRISIYGAACQWSRLNAQSTIAAAVLIIASF